MRDWFFALSVGVGITFVFFALGVAGKLSEPLLETLLSPGSMSARFAFGGLHGGEPIVILRGEYGVLRDGGLAGDASIQEAQGLRSLETH